MNSGGTVAGQTTPGRFAILHHTLAGSEHWDLMLEYGDSLLTWQLLKQPGVPGALPAPARRISNHRKDYLTYEGAVSGNRGTVRAIDRGNVTLIQLSDRLCRFRLDGSLLAGDFVLEQNAGSDWTLRKA